jgi:hypothetical protein
MNTSVITNELTLIYSEMKDAEGGMFTYKIVRTFTDESSEGEWVTKMTKQAENVPEDWGLCYSFKRV